MSDRDRLIELLFKVTEEKDCPQPHEIADYLLANGVIVPPCKVGDMVYCIEYNLMLIDEYTVDGYTFKNGKFALYVRSGIYSTVVSEWYLTKEQAEEKLKELGK